MNHLVGPEAAALSPDERRNLMEGAHRQHAPEAWRDLVAAERRALTLDDVLDHLECDSEEALRASLAREMQGYEFERLVASVKDEIAIARAKSKLSNDVWRRFNQEPA